MAEDGVTTSGYGAEYAWQIRAVGYSLVGDEVIPSNAKNTSLTPMDYRCSAVIHGLPRNCRPKWALANEQASLVC